MPNTAEGFYYPDANTNIAPLETVLANMAASSDTVSKQTPRVFANYAAMIAAIPTPTAGRLAVTTQGSGILWQYDGTAAKWVVQNTPTFTNTAAREAAIPNPTAGVKCVIGSGADYAEYVWTGAAWRLRGPRVMGKAATAGDVVVPPSYGSLLSVAPTMLAGAAVVSVTGHIANGLSGASRTATLGLYRDGALIGMWQNYTLPFGTGAAFGEDFAITIDVPAETAGAHTYALYGQASESSTVVVHNVRLCVEQGDG